MPSTAFAAHPQQIAGASQKVPIAGISMTGRETRIFPLLFDEIRACRELLVLILLSLVVFHHAGDLRITGKRGRGWIGLWYLITKKIYEPFFFF